MSELPPLDQSQAYVVVGPNDQRGPYTMELLISEVIAGRLSEATPVWWPGLADWTTMGGHPGVVDELARRRAATAPAAPGWADPSAAAAADPYAAAAAADPFSPPQPEPQPDAAPQPEPQPLAEPVAEPVAEMGESPVEDVEIVDAEVIEVDEVVIADPAQLEVFTALVARSAVRADLQARIDGVNEQLIGAVAAAVVDHGFTFSERVDVDRGAELRFDGSDGDLVMVSLGKATATRPEDLRDDHVPVTLSYRSGARVATADPGAGGHGDVVVASDEWTGQSTSSVSLFLGLGDCLDEHLTVDGPAVVRDIGATVAVLRSRLA